MHIAQFLHSLVLSPNIEIVEARLPHVSEFVIFPQAGLGGSFPASPLSQHLPCEALLHYLHHSGRRSFLRFADQNMKMLWHDHIAYYDQSVALTRLLQQIEKQVTPSRSLQQRQATITA